jgi:DNA-binding response OmpR family regulator
MKKILIIEDTAIFREIVKEILELENFQTILAENGKVGVEKAIAELPDLILSDIIMPEMDGDRVIEALRKHPSTASIPVILLTVKMLPQDDDRGLELGVDYLTKPFTCHELLKAIEIKLERSINQSDRLVKM